MDSAGTCDFLRLGLSTLTSGFISAVSYKSGPAVQLKKTTLLFNHLKETQKAATYQRSGGLPSGCHGDGEVKRGLGRGGGVLDIFTAGAMQQGS